MSCFPPRGPFQAAPSGLDLRIALALAVLVGAGSGCNTLDLPGLPLSRPEAAGPSLGQPVDPQQSGLPELYQSVRQAKAQNSVVLQVIGDEKPFRVLPLPPGQKSVFVSQLLTQTGVQSNLGKVKATLYRNTADSWTGLPMEVRMAEAGRRVRPESDYALRAGDRLRVEKDTTSAVQKAVDIALAR